MRLHFRYLTELGACPTPQYGSDRVYFSVATNYIFHKVQLADLIRKQAINFVGVTQENRQTN